MQVGRGAPRASVGGGQLSASAARIAQHNAVGSVAKPGSHIAGARIASVVKAGFHIDGERIDCIDYIANGLGVQDAEINGSGFSRRILNEERAQSYSRPVIE